MITLRPIEAEAVPVAPVPEVAAQRFDRLMARLAILPPALQAKLWAQMEADLARSEARLETALREG